MTLHNICIWLRLLCCCVFASPCRSTTATVLASQCLPHSQELSHVTWLSHYFITVFGWCMSVSMYNKMHIIFVLVFPHLLNPIKILMMSIKYNHNCSNAFISSLSKNGTVCIPATELKIIVSHRPFSDPLQHMSKQIPVW